ncbi:DUF2272 domain-containing protein [Caulobacter sp. 17J65-9]|uniref:DUF2272 domain-containing protein n=1 Tax=Caulobacter sp. 17J65-9 TaxID=2709382 RepID=UPI0013C7F060|nr:DUF2272 domain-containing protein [Caulobacter sp. 17J65-9]NEX94083.1 DUF2272 domain-containing protein [Caulobacter sp. 17J65-9]
MLRAAVLLAATLLTGAAGPDAPSNRLPRSVLDVIPPEERVTGGPGSFEVWQRACRVAPVGADTRRRLVDVAVQEWAVFGFQTLDLATTETRLLPGGEGDLELVPDALNPPLPQPRLTRRILRLGSSEDEEDTYATVAGYWTATPDGWKVLLRQNAIWREPAGEGRGWLQPWSAAFVSWVMCEGGLGDPDVFARSVAHWEYVDQAVAARQGRAPYAAFVAYDLGERDISPGDLLCNARGETTYRTVADRAAQAGEYAPLHCDLVVKVDPRQAVILTVGGNVLNSVSLSVLKAVQVNGRWTPVAEDELEGARRWFAHLKLRTPDIEADALDHTPTVQSLQGR